MKKYLLWGACLLLQEVSGAVEEGPSSMRITLRNREAKGVGYTHGYTTLAGFFSPQETYRDDLVPFVDLRAHIFNNGRAAANVGIGVRYFSTPDYPYFYEAPFRILGVNAYWDYRHTSEKSYNQISLGIESLGEWLDFRMNGYIPVGNSASSYYNTGVGYFSGNSLFIERKRQYSLAGFSGEFGASWNEWPEFPLYSAVGVYYLQGKEDTTWGGTARVTLTAWNLLELEAYVSYDHLFKWIGQGQIGLAIPFGPKTTVETRKGQCKKNARALARKARQDVQFNEIIPVDTKKTAFAAIDPLTNRSYIFWFVDNTSSSKGTFEDPFHTLADASAVANLGDVIYVFPGDGTTTGQADGITLKNRQQLLGATLEHSISTTFGEFLIPPQANGNLPGITNGNGDVITLASENVVSGFYISNTNGVGVGGQQVNNLSLTQNVIESLDSISGLSQIALINASGEITISENALFNLMSTASVPGIFIENTNIIGSIYNLSNNVINTDIGISLDFTDSSQNICNLANNRISSVNDGLSLQVTNAQEGLLNTFNISNNTLLNDSGNTLACFLNGATNGTFAFLGNSLGALGSSPTVFQVSDNAIASLQITDNRIGILSLQIQNQGAVSFAKIANNSLINQCNLVVQDQASLSSFLLSYTDVLGGFDLTATDFGSIPSLQVTHNKVLGALSLDIDEGAFCAFSVSDNNIVAPSLGLEVRGGVTNGSAPLLTGTIARNTIVAGSNPLVVELANGTHFSGSIANNTFSTVNASLGNCLITAADQTRISSLQVIGNAFFGSSRGMLVDLEDLSIVNLAVENNFFSLQTTSGIQATVSNTSTLIADIEQNKFTGFGENAVNVLNEDSGFTCMRFLSNTALPILDAYRFEQSGGTFNLEPPEDNLGEITTVGTITPVSSNSCQ